MKRTERDKRRLQDIIRKQKTPPLQTHFLNQEIANQEKITFAFIHLDLKRGKFSCNAGDGGKLLNIFDNLKKHSNYDLENIGTRKNSHFIPPDQITAHGLQDILALANGGKLFQLGSKQQAERIIGYFTSNRSNIFQVCLFDLGHTLSGD